MTKETQKRFHPVLYLKLFEHDTSTDWQIGNHILHNWDQQRRWLDSRSLHGLWVHEAMHSSIINKHRRSSFQAYCTFRTGNLSNIVNSVAFAIDHVPPNVEATATMCPADCCHSRCLPVASYRTWFCAPDAEWNTTGPTSSGWGRFARRATWNPVTWVMKNTLQGTITYPTKN